jgi:hypothetical protein
MDREVGSFQPAAAAQWPEPRDAWPRPGAFVAILGPGPTRLDHQTANDGITHRVLEPRILVSIG